MSGICATWHKGRADGIAASLEAMTARLGLADRDERPAREIAADIGLAVQARAPREHLYRDERVLIAFDTDLINESELAARVDQVVAASGTGALLAALYRTGGETFVESLRGGFALVLWDLAERRLMAAIDGFGIKRLAWFEDGRTISIASRADAVNAAAGGLPIDPRAIANIVNFTANLGPDTVFKGVRRLMPGTILRAAERETTQVRSYWDMRYGVGTDADERRLSKEMDAVMERSVAAHCAGEAVPRMGAYLSGGTDSSTIVGLLTRVTGGPVKAFSIGFTEPGFNELDYAELAAKHFGAEHHTYLVSASDCSESLPSIIRCFDEPYANSSAIATYFCGRLAKDKGVTTLLAGDGGDELFGGNERYATENLFAPYQQIPAPIRSHVIEPLTALPLFGALGRRGRGYVQKANMPGVERMLAFQFLKIHALGDIFDPEFVRALGDYSIVDVPARHYAAASAQTHLDRLLYVDMKITLADNDLPKVTCMSELAGLRSRFPYLDRNVAEFSGRVPSNLKVKRLQKRYLFKKAFGSLLPAEIIRKKKHGFGVPVAVWMRTDPRIRELAQDTLRSKRTHERGYFRRDFIEELLRRHEQNDDIFYGDTLWAFLMLELWHRDTVDVPAQVAR